MNGAILQSEIQLNREAKELARREYWTKNEGLSSELEFHRRLSCLIGEIEEGYRRNDLTYISDSLGCLLWVDDWVDAEPFVSLYESGLVSVFTSILHACADRYLLDQAYTVGARCVSMLRAKNERRIAQGLGSRPDSECWFRIYGAIAEIKWKGGPEYKDNIYSPRELAREFEKVERRCIDHIASQPAPNITRNQRIKEALAWCRLQVIKMAIRYEPGIRDELVTRFNKIHGPYLSSEVGHFQAWKPHDVSNPWYWDLELFKWCVQGPATIDEAMLCHLWRVDAMRGLGMSDDELLSYRNAADLEFDFLLNLSLARTHHLEARDVC